MIGGGFGGVGRVSANRPDPKLGIIVRRKFNIKRITSPPEPEKLSTPSRQPVGGIGVRFVAPFFDGSGYAEGARQWLAALKTAGVDILAEPVSFEEARADYGPAGKMVKECIGRDISCKISLIYLTPDMYPLHRKEKHYNIGLFEWETDRIPPKWVHECNAMDEIWVCSHWVADVARAGGVKKPINVFGHCVDPEEYKRVPAMDFPELPENCFKFYSIFQWTERKNPKGLLRAYLTAFRKKDPVVLILKTYRNDYSGEEQQGIIDEIELIKKEIGGKQPRILLIPEMLSRAEILSIHATGDCFVLPHRSEGWGLPHFDACMMGNPVITTRFGGNTEFVDDSTAFLTGYQLIRARGKPIYTQDMQWAEPDIGEFRKYLRLVYSRYEEAKARASNARLSVLEKYNYDRIGSAMKDRLLGIAQALGPIKPSKKEVKPVSTHERKDLVLHGCIPQVKGTTVFIIPSYRGGSCLERCLQTLREQHDGRMNYDIIVSFDGGPYLSTARELALKYGAQFVASQENSGFSRTVNRGIRAIDESVARVIIVNDDIYFTMPAGVVLSHVLESDPSIAIVGSLLLYPDGRIQHAGKKCASMHILHGQKMNKMAQEDREVLGITAAFMGISKKFLEQVQGFHEGYRLSWEDTDLCLSALMLGWKILYCGRAWAYHEEGGTRGATPEQKETKSQKWMNWEHASETEFLRRWGKKYAYEEWKEKPVRTKLKRIIIKRKTAIGDVLLMTPVIHALKQRFGDWEIVIGTDHPFVFRDNPEVSFVVPTDAPIINNRQCDQFYDLDLSYENNPGKGIVRSYADLCGVIVTDPWPKVFLREIDRKWAEDKLGDGKWMVIHPGPKAWPGGDWPFERFGKVAETFRREGWRIVLVGNGPDPGIDCELDLRHQTSYHRLAAIMERAGSFVGIDSMPLHLAEAFKKPSVGIFGCVDPSHILVKAPFIKGVTADPRKVNCLGCHHRRPPPVTTGICHRDRIYCMEELMTESVMKAIREVSGKH